MNDLTKIFNITDIGLVSAILEINLKNYEINKQILDSNKNDNIYKILVDILNELRSINTNLIDIKEREKSL